MTRFRPPLLYPLMERNDPFHEHTHFVRQPKRSPLEKDTAQIYQTAIALPAAQKENASFEEVLQASSGLLKPHSFLHSPGGTESPNSVSQVLPDNPETGPSKKSHKFQKTSIDPVVKVCLIPTHAEFKEAGLGDDLWYSGKDFATYKEDKKQELLDPNQWEHSQSLAEREHLLYQQDPLDPLNEVFTNTQKNPEVIAPTPEEKNKHRDWVVEDWKRRQSLFSSSCTIC